MRLQASPTIVKPWDNVDPERIIRERIFSLLALFLKKRKKKKKKRKKKEKTGRTEILSIQGYSTYCASLIRERSDQGRQGQTGKTVANLSTPRPRGRDVHVGRNFLDSKAPDSTASPGPFSWEPETDASRVRISGRCGLTHLLSQVRHALSRIYKKVV